MKYKLTVICMYCQCFIREHEVAFKVDAGISHGICKNKECQIKYDDEIERLKNEK